MWCAASFQIFSNLSSCNYRYWFLHCWGMFNVCLSITFFFHCPELSRCPLLSRIILLIIESTFLFVKISGVVSICKSTARFDMVRRMLNYFNFMWLNGLSLDVCILWSLSNPSSNLYLQGIERNSDLFFPSDLLLKCFFKRLSNV